MKLSCHDFAARDMRLSVPEAVALVLAAARELESRPDLEGRGLPPPEQILLSSDGRICLTAAGAEADDAERVRQLAALLHGFLPLEHESRGVAGHTRVPGALLVLVARATGQIDAAPPSYARFTQTLSRFAADDGATLKCLYWRCVGRDREIARGNAVPATVLPWREQTAAEAVFRLGERRRKHRRAAEFQRDFRRTRRRLRLQRLAIACGAVACVLVGGLGGWFLALRVFEHPSSEVRATLATATMRDTPEPEEAPVALASQTPAAVRTEPQPRRRDDGRDVGAPSPPPAAHVAPPSSSAAEEGVSAAPLVLAGAVGADAFSPSFDQQGRSVLFHAGRDRAALMRASIGDAGDVQVDTVLRDGAANYHATLSPDGEWLAYDSDRDGTRGVYVARADASRPRRISGDGYAAVPSWSPDGRRLTFVKADPRRPRVWNVWLADLEAGSLRRVSDHAVGQAWRAPWFPDGERIAYSVEETLVVVNLKEGTSRVFRSPLRGRLVRTPAVSPDGRSIVFQVHRDGAWLLDVATGRMRRLLADRSAEEFAWSPDGTQVAYHTRRGGAYSVWQVSMPDPR